MASTALAVRSRVSWASRSTAAAVSRLIWTLVLVARSWACSALFSAEVAASVRPFSQTQPPIDASTTTVAICRDCLGVSTIIRAFLCRWPFPTAGGR